MFFCQNCRTTSSCRECLSFHECNDCLKSICNNCREVNNAEFGIDLWDRCHDCGEIACEDCLDCCPDCHLTWCMECSQIHRCERCDKHACVDCGSGEEFGIDWCEDGYHCYCKQCRMDAYNEEGKDACDSCTALIADTVMMYETENADLKLTVKVQKDELVRLRKRVQEQEEELKRLKGGDSVETVPHIEEAIGKLDIH